MNFTEYGLTRREFIAATAIALIELELGHASAATDKGVAGRIGISNDAYAKAQVRAAALVAQMTTAEKITQLTYTAPAIDRLKIPKYNYCANEALHGICSGPPATSFPVPLALAAAWNPELVHRVYTAVSDECRAHSAISLFSPATLNLHRDPRWGRCYEAPGEDPCLASTYAVQVVRGMQGDDPTYLKATACSKHFICNNTDNDRDSVSATVDSRSFWEFYTRAYRSTVFHGDVFTFMTAYNAINGIPCSADKELLADILRKQWGFRGYVVSDCDAIADIFDPHHYAKTQAEASAMGIIAGCDLDCGKSYGQNLQDALDQGLVTVDQLGIAASRLMTVRVLLGLFDPPENVPYSNITLTSVDFKANAQLALESARQSLVLLKNESNFLPLDANKVQKVAIIGPLGNTCHLGGYAAQTPTTLVAPVKGIAERLGVSLPVNSSYIKGDDYSALNGTIATQPSPVGTNQLAFISNGNWAKYDNVDFTGKTSMVASVSSPFDGISIDVHLDAVDGPLACTLAVPNTRDWNTLANATASLNGITGSHNIYLVFNGCGGYFLNVEHLALEPVSAESGWTGGKQVIYRSGCRVTGDRVPRDFQDAVDVAKGADVVILVCGVNGDVDQEQRDRDDIRLTGAQPDLIQAVYAANPNTVLVLSSNNSVSVVWEQDNLPAIVGAICAGQEQGTAIAQLLFGDFNPGGKLPNTWYRSIDQLPDKHDYDIHNGRTYQYFTDKPLYPFGYGLSYTSFQIGSLTASSQTIASGGTAKYSVKVTNTGKVAGAEVVQLYVTAPATLVRRPLRQLAAFQRVELAPGEHKTVVFELPYTTQAFWYWDDDVKAFVCSSGEAQIQIGNSSASLPLTASLVLPHGQMPATAPDAVETVAGTSYIVQS